MKMYYVHFNPRTKNPVSRDTHTYAMHGMHEMRAQPNADPLSLGQPVPARHPPPAARRLPLLVPLLSLAALRLAARGRFALGETLDALLEELEVVRVSRGRALRRLRVDLIFVGVHD